MRKKIRKCCVTCQHYEPYHCNLTDNYIGYGYSDEPTKCRAYKLHDNYKPGGKFENELHE